MKALVEVVQRSMLHFSTPFIVLHGSDDRVTSPVFSRRLFDTAPCTDKVRNALK